MLSGVDFVCRGSKSCVKNIKPIQGKPFFQLYTDTLQPRGTEVVPGELPHLGEQRDR